MFHILKTSLFIRLFFIHILNAQEDNKKFNVETDICKNGTNEYFSNSNDDEVTIYSCCKDRKGNA